MKPNAGNKFPRTRVNGNTGTRNIRCLWLVMLSFNIEADQVVEAVLSATSQLHSQLGKLWPSPKGDGCLYDNGAARFLIWTSSVYDKHQNMEAF